MVHSADSHAHHRIFSSARPLFPEAGSGRKLSIHSRPTQYDIDSFQNVPTRAFEKVSSDIDYIDFFAFRLWQYTTEISFEFFSNDGNRLRFPHQTYSPRFPQCM